MERFFLSLNDFNPFSLAIVNLYGQRHLAYSEVRGTPEARVVSSESHLNHVEQAVVYLTTVNQAFSCVAN